MRIKLLQSFIDFLKGKNKFPQQKILNEAKYVHLMHNDKFNKPFVDFLNRNFNPREHLVLCKRIKELDAIVPFPDADNVIEINKLKNIDFSSPKIEKIICHSLFIPGLVDLLYERKELLGKSYWMVWGGDLYGAVRDEKNDFVRKNVKGYIGDLDKDYMIEKYGVADKPFYKAFYNFPISKEMLDKTTNQPRDYVRIQINNSSDESTLEMLDVLAKFRHENIRVTTVLSYGKLEYKDLILCKGYEIFGEKFEPVEKFMASQDYAQHLAQNDILILNQNRQQGVGNTLASLGLGKKVFIRSDVSVNTYLNNEKIRVFNSDDIIKTDFETFVRYDEKEQTLENVAKYFSEAYLAKLFGEFLNA